MNPRIKKTSLCMWSITIGLWTYNAIQGIIDHNYRFATASLFVVLLCIERVLILTDDEQQ